MSWFAFLSAALLAAGGPGIDGVVVDSRTDRPIHSVEVSIYSWESGAPELAAKVSTDAEGRFAVPAQVRGPFSASLFDPATQAPLGNVPENGQLPEFPDPWRVKVELGPTIPFRLGDGAQDVREWRLRLVERDATGDERVWPWRAAHPGDPAWIRYPRYEYEPSPAYTAFLEAQVRDRTRKATGRVPEDGGVTSLTLAPLGSVGGRALFQEGDLPAAGVAVRAVPLDRPEDWDAPAAWPATRSDETGQFAIAGLDPGRYLLLAEESGTPLARAEVSVAGPAAVDLDLRGGPHALVVSVGGTGEAGWLVLSGEPEGGPLEVVRRRPGRPGSRCRFDGLASGPYEVSFQSLLGGEEDRQRVVFHAEPRASDAGSAELEPRTVELLVDAPPPTGSGFTVHAFHGDLADEPYLQVWTDRLWFPEMLPEPRRTFHGGPFAWAVGAPGHRPVLGRADEPGDVTVSLEQGWGVRLLLRSTDHLEFPSPEDWATYVESRHDAAPVAGAAVIVDGVEVGVTDGDGALWLEGPAPPERIELRHSTMAVVASPLFRDGRCLGTSAEVVVWMRSTGPR